MVRISRLSKFVSLRMDGLVMPWRPMADTKQEQVWLAMKVGERYTTQQLSILTGLSSLQIHSAVSLMPLKRSNYSKSLSNSYWRDE